MSLKAAIYARYSSDIQRDESIDAQVRAIKEYTKRNGFTVVEVYADRARTATSDRRPEFQRLFVDCDKGLFDVVIVHKLDRFSRDKYDFASYRRKLRVAGVRLLSVLENLDDSPESGMLESMLEGMAEYYSKNLSREVMKGLKETALQGKHTGGRPPIGYAVDKETQTLITNDQERPIIELIFSQYLQGHGYKQITQLLEQKGFRSRLGRPISKATIHDILRCEKYTGTYLYNVTDSKDALGKSNGNRKKDESEIIRIENGIPAIISKADFEAVQKLISDNHRTRRSGSYTAKEQYLLSGLILCGECQRLHNTKSGMTGNVKYSGRSKLKYVTYRCNRKDNSRSCSNKEIRREHIEGYIVDYLQNHIFSEGNIPKLLEQVNQQIQKAETQEIGEKANLQQRLRAVTDQITNIVNAVAQGFTQASFVEKVNLLEVEKANLEVELARLMTKEKRAGITEDALRSLLFSLKDSIAHEDFPELKRFVQTYVQQVLVYTDQVEVEFKLPVVTHVSVQNGAEGIRTPVRR
ncbi:recombinase family protein [Paenibacillus sp. 19GGS1-52]|uniref:recombinase family protein n=1 Tax=Paenibacillus sp. 19GGS1-52 TaxID=2758563 RepID=UPI001EFAB5A6|nr:recombinase family protein [Paenibacillus sp. 19GGS1-52]ULO07409.1 recombinase family protein [Paenibacillus sp. 19GGS1-52]